VDLRPRAVEPCRVAAARLNGCDLVCHHLVAGSLKSIERLRSIEKLY
jgi:hypothetical protein